MEDLELKLAVTRLEKLLRRMPSEEQKITTKDYNIELRHPIDLTGTKDYDYLIADFSSPLPPYWIHQRNSTVKTYVDELIKLGIKGKDVRRLNFQLACTRMPISLRIWNPLSLVFGSLGIPLGFVVHVRQCGNLTRFSERLGRPSINRPSGKLIWLHASSLGEVKQLTDLATRIQDELDVTVLVTTQTGSSAHWVETTLPNTLYQFAPLDTRSSIQNFLTYWQPDILVIAENELWPHMMQETARAGIMIVQIGARISKTRRRFPKTTGFLISNFSLITCPTKNVQADLIKTGVDDEIIYVSGDARLSRPPLPVDNKWKIDISNEIGPRRVWTAASTHKSDIEIVLDAHQLLSKTLDTLLIIAPRHMTDVFAIQRACFKRKLKFSLRSTCDKIDSSINVYIVDSFNELGTLFCLSKAVYLGGGFGGEGGHNPYEPHAFECYILSGPSVQNYQHAFDHLIDVERASYVSDARDLSRSIQKGWEKMNLGESPPIKPLRHRENSFDTEKEIINILRKMN